MATYTALMLGIVQFTWNTKSLPRKSTIVRGRRVRPQTNRRNRDRSALEKLSSVSQNQRTNGALASTPLYVTTDFNRSRGMSGLPHTIVSSSGPVNNDSKGTGTTRAMPSRTADTWRARGNVESLIVKTSKSTNSWDVATNCYFEIVFQHTAHKALYGKP